MSFLYFRRLFPALLVSVRGLDENTEYTISLRISSADPYRYKFLNMQWVSVGESEVMQNEDRQIYCHYNSPSTGTFWMKKPISFKSVKITHNPSSKHGNVSYCFYGVSNFIIDGAYVFSYRSCFTQCTSI